MKSPSLIIYIFAFIFLTACSIETTLHSNYLLPANVELKSLALAVKGEDRIVGKSCSTKVGVPLMLSFDTDAALTDALKKAPSLVGLADAVVVSEILVIGVFSRVCTEVRGLPLNGASPT